MLEHTFCHIPRITPATEAQLWAAGVHTWQDAMTAVELPVRGIGRNSLRVPMEESLRELAAGNCRYFAAHLPSHLHWRLFPAFRERAAFLDIETTGLSASSGDSVTCIALYDGRRARTYVQGQNLADFAADVAAYDVLVTYNGKCFDIPFLRNSLHLAFDQVHIDLRYVLRRLGYRGGLKGCEKQLGINRDELDGVDGFMAVQLWWQYQNHHDLRALETLQSYNIQDVLNLETLLVMAYNQELRATPFEAARTLALPVLPPNPYVPDTDLIGRLLNPSPRFA